MLEHAVRKYAGTQGRISSGQRDPRCLAAATCGPGGTASQSRTVVPWPARDDGTVCRYRAAKKAAKHGPSEGQPTLPGGVDSRVAFQTTAC